MKCDACDREVANPVRGYLAPGTVFCTKCYNYMENEIFSAKTGEEEPQGKVPEARSDRMIKVEIRQNDMVGSVRTDEKGKVISDRRRKRGSRWWQEYDTTDPQEAIRRAKAQWPRARFPGCTYKVVPNKKTVVAE